MKIKIALDCNIGKKRYQEFIDLGYAVVSIAKEGEPDDQWVGRAFNAGARFVISNDGDVPKIIEVKGYPMIWIDFPTDGPLRQKLLVDYVDQMINFKLKVFHKILEEIE